MCMYVYKMDHLSILVVRLIIEHDDGILFKMK